MIQTDTIRNKIPIFVKDIFEQKSYSLSEGDVSDTLGSITKEVGARVLAGLHNLNQAAAQKNISDANRIRSDILMHHYAAQLGVRSSHIRTVLNDYEKEKPVAPSPVLIDSKGKPILIPGKKGKSPSVAINPNFAIEKREYDSKSKEYEERERLKKQIKGLHKSIPLLGQIAKGAADYTDRARESLRDANPIVSRRPLGLNPTPGLPDPRTPRNTTTSKVLTQYADALRARRKIRKRIDRNKL